MKILVTGAAGFIGSKLAYVLAERGDDVIGIDNINNYYDVRLKYARLHECGFNTENDNYVFCTQYISTKLHNLKFIRMDIADNKKELEKLFKEEKFDKVVNLAAQAGVRYSITNPYAYLESNLIGFLNILECCRYNSIKHLVYASSSSVYGMNEKIPFNEEDKVDTPVSLYAASKKSNELMAHAYSKLYNLPTAGLRYFTVYGPYGRPDMAPMIFAKAISEGKPINVFNNGDLSRDFTYIDDIVEGTKLVIDKTLLATDCPNNIPYTVYNIGCSSPIKLMDFISTLEKALGKEAIKNYLPMQNGDVYKTYADTNKLEKEVEYRPIVDLTTGIERFIEWYRSNKNPLKK